MCEFAVGQSTFPCLVTGAKPCLEELGHHRCADRLFPFSPVGDSRPFRHPARRSTATQSNERTSRTRLVPPPHRQRNLPPAAELPLLCPRLSAPPPAASRMITRRSEDKFSLIRKRLMRLYTPPSMTKRAQKRQAKEKRKDRNCTRRPITSPVSFLCTALPSAAVGKCAHQYKLKTVLCRHHAEKTDTIEHDA